MTKAYTNILFDLDGTLTDSASGIINAIKYAFDKMHVPCPDNQTLLSYIGPPLVLSYGRHFADKARLEKAIYYTREYYADKGRYENSLFQGIPKLLEKLKRLGYSLYVATCKGTLSAREILSDLDVVHYFIYIQGVEEDIFDKTEVIARVMAQFDLQAQDTLFIGDTLHDSIGAKENNIDMCFVTYGFGEISSVANMPIICYASTPDAIAEFLTDKRLS